MFDNIINNFWFWPVIIILGVIGLFILVIRDAVVSYKQSGPVPKEKHWQVRIYAASGSFVITALIIGMAMMNNYPIYVPAIVGGWVILNAALVPQKVSWATAILYSLQVAGSGVIMIMILRFLLIN